MRKLLAEAAVGQVLGHDIVHIIPGREKYRAFQRGHVITEDDLPLLRELGRDHVFIWEPEAGLVHEDEAAQRLARAAAGPGLQLSEVAMGRVNLSAEYDGLLKVEVERLAALNNLDMIIFSTLHKNRPVVKGTRVAGTRVVPLTVEQGRLKTAEQIAGGAGPLIYVKPYKPLKVSVITTGGEVYRGTVEDGFGPVLRPKIDALGGQWMEQCILPDDSSRIAAEIDQAIAKGAELILVTGGMSVDADDVTPEGIRSSGAEVIFYGAPVLPGSQYLMAYRGVTAIIGVPGGALFNRVTTLDLLLPRVFAGERISRSDIAVLGHGSLCEECEICRFPACSFGK